MVFMMAGYGTQEDMDAVKLHIHKLSDDMRWQIIDEIYADDSWNDQNQKSLLKRLMNQVGVLNKEIYL